jgi:hypothetical protein
MGKKITSFVSPAKKKKKKNRWWKDKYATTAYENARIYFLTEVNISFFLIKKCINYSLCPTQCSYKISNLNVSSLPDVGSFHRHYVTRVISSAMICILLCSRAYFCAFTLPDYCVIYIYIFHGHCCSFNGLSKSLYNQLRLISHTVNKESSSRSSNSLYFYHQLYMINKIKINKDRLYLSGVI